MRFDKSQPGGDSEKPPTGRQAPDSSAPLIPTTMTTVQRINHLVEKWEGPEGRKMD